MDIEILNKKLIKPSSPTPPHFTTLNLSPLDLIVPRVYMAAVGYYPAPETNDTSLEDSIIRKSMERSLSENLTLFYPFAGRYDEKRQIIDCSDQGVEYVEAKVVNCDLAGVLYGKADAMLLERLVPAGSEESPTTPLLLIQLNIFRCGGVAVGFRFSHRIADAMTLSNFINGWATTCRGGVNDLIRPSFDLGHMLPFKEEGWVKPYSPWKNEPSNIVTKRFLFNKASLSSLRSMVGASRVMLVTALIWKALMRGKNGSFLTHILNMRNRTHVPVPGNICGNFWRCVNTRCTAGDAEVELEELVGLLSGSIQKSAAECGKVRDGDELVLQARAALVELCKESEQENAEFRVFTSWCRFPMYEADFGWGRPIWVSSVHLPVRITVLIDSYDGEGVEAWMSLEESEMGRLEQDSQFLAFTS